MSFQKLSFKIKIHFLIFFSVFFMVFFTAPSALFSNEVFPKAHYVVTDVIDGETIVVNNTIRISLVGIDAPNANQNFDPRVMEFVGQKSIGPHCDLTKKTISYIKDQILNEPVNIEFDPSNAYFGHKDRNGKWKAYIFHKEKSFFLNAEIIKHGFAKADLRFPFKYSGEFFDYQNMAKSEKRGFWAEKKIIPPAKENIPAENVEGSFFKGISNRMGRLLIANQYDLIVGVGKGTYDAVKSIASQTDELIEHVTFQKS